MFLLLLGDPVCAAATAKRGSALAHEQNQFLSKDRDSQTRRKKTDTPGWTRTSDPLLRRQMLYPLSYGGSVITLRNQSDLGKIPNLCSPSKLTIVVEPYSGAFLPLCKEYDLARVIAEVFGHMEDRIQYGLRVTLGVNLAL